MKIKDIIEKIAVERREEIIKTINACMKSICCENVKWMEFNVYETSFKHMEMILQRPSAEFLLPIAEKAKEEEREVTILCNETKDKNDEIWFTRLNASELYAIINISCSTAKYLSKKTE